MRSVFTAISLVSRVAQPFSRFVDDGQVLLPIWFPFGAFQRVAGTEKLLEVGWGFEGVGSLLFFEPLVGGDPEPLA